MLLQMKKQISKNSKTKTSKKKKQKKHAYI